jgi:hypothetical protein
MKARINRLLKARALTIASVLLAACQVTAPVQNPAAVITMTVLPAAVLEVDLRANADRYTAPEAAILLTLKNRDSEPIYLPICGPWQIIRTNAPDRPAWGLACEIDYLGHKVEAGQTFTGTVRAKLSPGAYQANVRVYGRCHMGQPQVISASETNYGEFGACPAQQRVFSNPFTVIEK